MKLKIFAFILLTAASLPARTFTSSDGKKTMEAELISYNPAQATVVIKLEGSHVHTNAPADSFSSADRDYFVEFFKEKEKHTAITADAEKVSERFNKIHGHYTYAKRKEGYKVLLRNSADYAFKDLTAKYDIYATKYDEAGGKSTEVISGEETLDEIVGNGTAEFDTEVFELTHGCKTSSSCPKCVRKAASYERERTNGIRVRVYRDGEELLMEYFSSNSIRPLSEKMDEKK